MSVLTNILSIDNQIKEIITQYCVFTDVISKPKQSLPVMTNIYKKLQGHDIYEFKKSYN